MQRQYIGELYDISTSLQYLNARYMKSDIGQFISQDSMFWTLPMELLIDPQQQNSYSYARNNPIIMKDPSGNITLQGAISSVKKALSSLFGKSSSNSNTIQATTLVNSNSNSGTGKSVLSQSSWVSQMPDLKGCYDACIKTAGYAPSGQINVQTFDSSGKLTMSPTAQKGIETIDRYLSNNVPVIIGVNRDGGRRDENYNPASQHFVTISGYNYDDNGNKYYNFYDPGTSRVEAGTSLNNRLYPNTNGGLSGSTSYNSSYYYSVTEVKIK